MHLTKDPQVGRSSHPRLQTAPGIFQTLLAWPASWLPQPLACPKTQTLHYNETYPRIHIKLALIQRLYVDKLRDRATTLVPFRQGSIVHFHHPVFVSIAASTRQVCHCIRPTSFLPTDNIFLFTVFTLPVLCVALSPVKCQKSPWNQLILCRGTWLTCRHGGRDWTKRFDYRAMAPLWRHHQPSLVNTSLPHHFFGDRTSARLLTWRRFRESKHLLTLTLTFDGGPASQYSLHKSSPTAMKTIAKGYDINIYCNINTCYYQCNILHYCNILQWQLIGP